mgnify:CR=1 FL=1
MQIIGHRGARGEAPENTLGGFRYLHDLGIRAVEFDVRQLSDQQLVVIHDDNFLRTTGHNQLVEPLCIGDLCYYDHRHTWQDWPQQEPTPTLQQALDILKDFRHLEVEVKSVKDDATAERLVQRLETTLAGLEKIATITSFDTKILSALQKNQSIFKRGLLIELPFGEYAIESALQYGCSRIGWKDQLASAALIKATQQANLDVSVWTVNDLDRAKQLRDLGINGLITDYPKLMQQL